jgi:hypothetical protein
VSETVFIVREDNNKASPWIKGLRSVLVQYRLSTLRTGSIRPLAALLSHKLVCTMPAITGRTAMFPDKSTTCPLSLRISPKRRCRFHRDCLITERLPADRHEEKNSKTLLSLGPLSCDKPHTRRRQLNFGYCVSRQMLILARFMAEGQRKG